MYTPNRSSKNPDGFIISHEDTTKLLFGFIRNHSKEIKAILQTHKEQVTGSHTTMMKQMKLSEKAVSTIAEKIQLLHTCIIKVMEQNINRNWSPVESELRNIVQALSIEKFDSRYPVIVIALKLLFPYLQAQTLEAELRLDSCSVSTTINQSTTKTVQSICGTVRDKPENPGDKTELSSDMAGHTPLLLRSDTEKLDNLFASTSPNARKSLWTQIKEATQRMLTFADKVESQSSELEKGTATGAEEQADEQSSTPKSEVKLQLTSEEEASVRRLIKDEKLAVINLQLLKAKEELAKCKQTTTQVKSQETAKGPPQLPVSKQLENCRLKLNAVAKKHQCTKASKFEPTLSWCSFSTACTSMEEEKCYFIDSNKLPVAIYLSLPFYVAEHVLSAMLKAFSLLSSDHSKAKLLAKELSLRTNDYKLKPWQEPDSGYLALPSEFDVNNTGFSFTDQGLACDIALKSNPQLVRSLLIPVDIKRLHKYLLIGEKDTDDFVPWAMKMIRGHLQNKLKAGLSNAVELYLKEAANVCHIFGKSLVELGRNGQSGFLNLTGYHFTGVNHSDILANNGSRIDTSNASYLEVYDHQLLMYHMIIMKAHLVHCYDGLWIGRSIDHENFPRVTRLLLHGLLQSDQPNSYESLESIPINTTYEEVWAKIGEDFLSAFILDASQNIANCERWQKILKLLSLKIPFWPKDEDSIKCHIPHATRVSNKNNIESIAGEQVQTPSEPREDSEINNTAAVQDQQLVIRDSQDEAEQKPCKEGTTANTNDLNLKPNDIPDLQPISELQKVGQLQQPTSETANITHKILYMNRMVQFPGVPCNDKECQTALPYDDKDQPESSGCVLEDLLMLTAREVSFSQPSAYLCADAEVQCEIDIDADEVEKERSKKLKKKRKRRRTNRHRFIVPPEVLRAEQMMNAKASNPADSSCHNEDTKMSGPDVRMSGPDDLNGCTEDKNRIGTSFMSHKMRRAMLKEERQRQRLEAKRAAAEETLLSAMSKDGVLDSVESDGDKKDHDKHAGETEVKEEATPCSIHVKLTPTAKKRIKTNPKSAKFKSKLVQNLEAQKIKDGCENHEKTANCSPSQCVTSSGFKQTQASLKKKTVTLTVKDQTTEDVQQVNMLKPQPADLIQTNEMVKTHERSDCDKVALSNQTDQTKEDCGDPQADPGVIADSSISESVTTQEAVKPKQKIADSTPFMGTRPNSMLSRCDEVAKATEISVAVEPIKILHGKRSIDELDSNNNRRKPAARRHKVRRSKLLFPLASESGQGDGDDNVINVTGNVWGNSESKRECPDKRRVQEEAHSSQTNEPLTSNAQAAASEADSDDSVDYVELVRLYTENTKSDLELKRTVERQKQLLTSAAVTGAAKTKYRTKDLDGTLESPTTVNIAPDSVATAGEVKAGLGGSLNITALHDEVSLGTDSKSPDLLSRYENQSGMYQTVETQELNQELLNGADLSFSCHAKDRCTKNVNTIDTCDSSSSRTQLAFQDKSKRPITSEVEPNNLSDRFVKEFGRSDQDAFIPGFYDDPKVMLQERNPNQSSILTEDKKSELDQFLTPNEEKEQNTYHTAIASLSVPVQSVMEYNVPCVHALESKSTKPVGGSDELTVFCPLTYPERSNDKCRKEKALAVIPQDTSKLIWNRKFLMQAMHDPIEVFMSQQKSLVPYQANGFHIERLEHNLHHIPVPDRTQSITSEASGSRSCIVPVEPNTPISSYTSCTELTDKPGVVDYYIKQLPPNRKAVVGQFKYGIDAVLKIGPSFRDGIDVYIGSNEKQEMVAVKQILRRSSQIVTQILGAIHKVNLVKLLEISIHNPRALIVVSEMCDCNLKAFLNSDSYKEGGFPLRKRLCFELLSGLHALHSYNITHNNLKPENVLIGKDGILKVGDYPVSAGWLDILMQAPCRHPERLCWESTEEKIRSGAGRHYLTHRKDIQVCGMLLHYIMCDGQHPFGQLANPISVDSNIRAGLYSINLVDTGARHLLTWMLPVDPGSRKDCYTCLTHPLFWNKNIQVSFLASVGCQPEIRSRLPSPVLQHINSISKQVQFGDWRKSVDGGILEESSHGGHYADTIGGLLQFISDFNSLSDRQLKKLRATYSVDKVTYILSRFSTCILPVYSVVIHSPLSLRTQIHNVINTNIHNKENYRLYN